MTYFPRKSPTLESVISTRPPQDVDVLAVLDFQIPFSRPETPGFYPRCLLTKHEGRGHKLGRPG